MNDGGPAYPRAKFLRPHYDGTGSKFLDYGKNGNGMSLRDWFAGQALPGLATANYGDLGFGAMASEAYDIANAMIAERKNHKA